MMNMNIKILEEIKRSSLFTSTKTHFSTLTPLSQKPSSSFLPKTHPLPPCFDAGGPLHRARRGGALLHSPIQPLSPTSTPSITPPSSPLASSNRTSPPPSTFTATKSTNSCTQPNPQFHASTLQSVIALAGPASRRHPRRSCVTPSPSPSLFPALSSLAHYCKPPHCLAVHCSPCPRRGGTVKLSPTLVTSSPLVLRSSVPDSAAPLGPFCYLYNYSRKEIQVAIARDDTAA
ncbi:hypothetical protein PIB30_050009 [Stylosanthes scabra]|uniref:Uncharacterized protein n=1 Tax=Stylosanthes scabra TaxID=79078 RepID=A0ABU6UG73_9FABA|nr:hypothetical protein [Stylosanthes scabra]